MNADPFAKLEFPLDGIVPAPPITTWEGWRDYVNCPVSARPAMPSLSVFEGMAKTALADFSRARRTYHSKFPFIETPDMASFHAEALRLAVMNFHAPPGARTGVILDGLGTLGKSTMVMELGKKYERQLIARVKASGLADRMPHRFLPVCYCTLQANLSVKTFNARLLHFFGIQLSHPDTNTQLDHITEAASKCGTSMFIVDDIHFLRMKNKSAIEVNNHLKALMSSISATFVYAGIDVQSTGLLLDGYKKEQAHASQTRSRFKRFELRPFVKGSRELRKLLNSFENNLCLMRQPQGDLVTHEQYIQARTNGYMGAISQLIRESANESIRQGVERITRKIMDSITLDFAAEQHADMALQRTKKRTPAASAPTAESEAAPVVKGRPDPNAATEAFLAAGSVLDPQA